MTLDTEGVFAISAESCEREGLTVEQEECLMAVDCDRNDGAAITADIWACQGGQPDLTCLTSCGVQHCDCSGEQGGNACYDCQSACLDDYYACAESC
jgi:hypothetical protein